MRNPKRVVGIALVASTLALVAAPTATAHAWLLEGNPGPNQHVTSPPDTLFLRFTEQVERDYTGAEVADEGGQRVDQGSVIFRDDGTSILVPLKPLTDGIYTVKWHTLSVDTHTAAGSYVFAVGNASLEGAPPPQAGHAHGGGPIPLPLEAASRAAFYAGILLAFGVAAFLLTIPRRGPEPDARRIALLLRSAAAIALVAAIGAILVLAAFAGRIDATLNDAMATRTGRLLAGRVICALFLCFSLALASRRPNIALLGATALVGFAGIAATSMSSHAAAIAADATRYVLIDAVHLLAAAIWIGGVVALLVLAPAASAEGMQRWVGRFSPIALACVAIILLTGTLAALAHLDAWGQLTRGNYGLSLLAKILLLVPLVILGAVNRYWVRPRLATEPEAQRHLRRNVAAETVLMAAVLVAAGLLTSSAPPTDAAETEAADALEFEKSLKTAHMILSLSPTPPRVGIMNITVSLHPFGSDPNPAGTVVFLKFAAPGQPEPDTFVEMNRTTSETWSLRGTYFTERGAWTVYVVVQRPDEYAKNPFTVQVGQ